MSMFNLSAVFAYLFSGKMIAAFDYLTMLYIGAALTMISVVMLVFIDPDETDRVLEGKLEQEDNGDNGGDFGEGLWSTDGKSIDADILGGNDNVTIA